MISQKNKTLLYTALLLGLLGYGYFSSRNQAKALSSCSREAKGTIIEIVRRPGKIPVAHYAFTVEQKLLNGSQSISNNTDLHQVGLGGEVSIIYQCEDWTNSRINLPSGK